MFVLMGIGCLEKDLFSESYCEKLRRNIFIEPCGFVNQFEPLIYFHFPVKSDNKSAGCVKFESNTSATKEEKEDVSI